LGENPTKHKKRKTNLKKKQAKGSVLNEGAFKIFSRFV
jgi:hypothetical protein